MRRTVLALLALLVLPLVTLSAGPVRPPVAVKAEESFFAAFNHDPREKAAPLRPLWMAALTDPTDSRTWMLLGLDHLWLAAEGDKTSPLTVEHLVLSERFLSRAQELDPSDHRIPSWLVPVRLSLAGITGPRNPKEQKEARDRIIRELLAAYAEDPAFHSFALALVSFDSGRDTPDFQRGLTALHQTHGACTGNPENPACANRPRWPHNQEAFLTFEADYELKARNTARARDLLLEAQQRPTYPQWPFRGETEDRLKNLDAYAALYADGDPGNDPPHLMASSQGIVCQRCHLGP